ncbi:hypothetical protein N7G274_003964 [Stereocaulon virgatum]|uniref:Methyltransferase type 11 domain-containing protein n=1 Tax=Stereocaulon virgatum TaxID=373712 RepID=A0ABR4ACW2_9LECA
MPATMSTTDTDTMHKHQTNDMQGILSSMFEGPLAKTYNDRTGGCNIILANHLINLTTPHLPAPTEPLRILDNACGPAVLTTQCMRNEAITAHQELHISATDTSADFITANRALISSNPNWTCAGRLVDTDVMNGMDLAFPDNTFDVSFTSLGIFAFPDPVRGAAELYRTLKAGGVAALTTWKRVGWMPLLHEVEQMLQPGCEPTHFPLVEAWMGRGKLEQTLRDGGFEDVVEGEVVGHAWWPSVEEAAGRLAETTRMMVGSGWTVGEKEKMEGGFLDVLRAGGQHVRRGQGGEVGVEMVAWTAVAKK